MITVTKQKRIADWKLSLEWSEMYDFRWTGCMYLWMKSETEEHRSLYLLVYRRRAVTQAVQNVNGRVFNNKQNSRRGVADMLMLTRILQKQIWTVKYSIPSLKFYVHCPSGTCVHIRTYAVTHASVGIRNLVFGIPSVKGKVVPALK